MRKEKGVGFSLFFLVLEVKNVAILYSKVRRGEEKKWIKWKKI